MNYQFVGGLFDAGDSDPSETTLMCRHIWNFATNTFFSCLDLAVVHL